MLIDLGEELAPHKFSGVVQVGAHHGQEHETFVRLGCRSFLYIEPQSRPFEVLRSKFSGHPFVRLEHCAIGNVPGTMTMYCETANQGMSSSLLKPQIHLRQYPSIVFDRTEEVLVRRLADVLDDQAAAPARYDLLVIDVQGYELEVLKSGIDGLSIFPRQFAFILAEVNRAPLYAGCPMVGDLDTFLEPFGFARIKTNWAGGTWGDALYMQIGRYKRIPFFQRFKWWKTKGAR
jgi:FkbM family methyltransferase